MASSSGSGHGPGTSDSRATSGLARFYDWLGYFAGAILAVMALSVFVQVVMRTLGLVGIDGLEEIPRYLFIWLVMIGGAAAMWRNEHTILDYFINKLSPRVRALVIAFTNAVAIALFLYLLKLSFVLVPNSQLQTSAGLNLPLGYVFAAVPVGAVLIVIPMVRNVLSALGELWPKSS